VFTIGYERATLAGVVRTMAEARIVEVVDIRRRASSRRKVFSKSPLSAALKEAGIGYRHVRGVGTPPEMKHRLARDRDYSRFFADYAVISADPVQGTG